MTHLGMSMLKAGPEAQAAIVERESGVRTAAAQDGMRIDVGRLKIEGTG